MSTIEGQRRQISRHRPLHIYREDMFYFVTCSTRGKKTFLDTEAKRDLLRDVLKEKTKNLGVRLTAWVILKNHYHLLFHVPSKETLASFMSQINGRSSYEINRLDGIRGRSIWYNYWDRCPRNERDFYSFFNYIHINPLKHGDVHFPESVLQIQGENWRLNADRTVNFHEMLAQYPYSSYPFYLRKYGGPALTHVWMDYPIPVDLEGME